MRDPIEASERPAPAPAGEPSPPRRRRAWLAPAIAFVLAFALRLPLVNAGLFHHDEVQLARAVEGSLERHTLLPAVNGRYGAVLLALAFHAPWYAATGASAERVVPFVGIVTGALLVALVLLLGRELTGDPLAGALAAAFAGTGTLFLTTSSTGKETTPEVAFVVLAAWLLARGAAAGSWPLRLAAACAFAFAASIHGSAIVLVPAYAWAAIALERRARRGLAAIALDLVAVAAALAVPLRLSIWEELRRSVLVAGANSATFLGPFSEQLPAALEDAVTGLGLPVLLLAGAGAVLAARALLRREAPPLHALLPWPLAVLYFGNVTVYTPRYLLNVLPPVAILAGAAAAAGLRRWVPARLAPAGLSLAAVAVAAAVGAPGVARAYPLLAARAAHSGPKTMALLVAERTERDAILLCQDDSPFLEYYAPGRTLLKQPIDDPAATAALVHELKRRVREGARLYASGEYAFAYDDAGYFRFLLGQAFEWVPVGEVTNEWYPRPELRDLRFPDVLYRLDAR